MSGRLLFWIVPSMGSLLFLITLYNGLFLSGHRLFSGDGDVGRHIRVGRTILQTAAIPHTDLFSHTAFGSEFIPYEWFSEVATALVDQVFGLAGVAVAAALLYAIASFAVYRTAEALGSRRVFALAIAVLAMVMQVIHYLPRPHLLTTALAGVFMILLVRFARSGSGWYLAPLPFLMILWANSHGGFLIGFILVGGFAASAWLRSSEFVDYRQARLALSAVLAACFGASLINPVGFALWPHTTGYLGIDFLVAATDEYQSIDFQEFGGKFFFVLLFAGPVLWMTGRTRVTLLAGGFYLLFAAAALHSARNIPLFTVVSLPWLALWLEQWLESMRESSPRWTALDEKLAAVHLTDTMLRPGLAVVAGGAIIWAALGPYSPRYDWSDDVFPVAALQALDEADMAGPVFNRMIWGGYMLYEYPEIPVFIDGQTDFYGQDLTKEYVQTLFGQPGWEHVLDRYGVQWTLTSPGAPLSSLLSASPDWTLRYEDDVAVVYRRAGTTRPE